jgi:hypothetical protein
MLSVCSGLKGPLPTFVVYLTRLSLTLMLSLCIAIPIVQAEPSLPDAEDDSSWSLELDRNGIQVYTQDWPGSRFPAVRTVQTVSSTLPNAASHFLNTEAYPEWATDMHEARVLVPVNDNMERVIYMHMDLPWPLKDRDSVVVQGLSQDPETLAVSFKERNANDKMEEQPNIIRLPKVNAELVLVPVSPKETKIIWQGHNEPGGYLPAFVFRWMLENILYQSSLNMRQRLETPSMVENAGWITASQ